MKRENTNVLIMAVLILGVSCAWAGDGAIEITSVPFTITDPGSYIFTDNLTVTNVAGATAIDVQADDVVIDMNGFRLRGQGGLAPGTGIYQSSANSRLMIRNGTIEHCGLSGLLDEGAVRLLGGGNIIRDIRVTGNRYGIVCGEYGVVIACTAYSNTQTGIVANNGSTVTRCAAYDNGLDGFTLGNDCTLSGSTAGANANNGISAADGCRIVQSGATLNGENGIDAGANCVISDSASYANASNGIDVGTGTLVERCIANTNGVDGFSVRAGCTVSDCAAYANNIHGIRVTDGCRVENSLASGNRTSGIRLYGTSSYVSGNTCKTNGHSGINAAAETAANHIEGNHVIGNGYGIYENGQTNILIKNFASENTVQEYFVNGAGVIFPVTSAAAPSIPCPWVNFVY